MFDLIKLSVFLNDNRDYLPDMSMSTMPIST